MDIPWRIVRVLSNCEKKVADHLTARLVENYFPVVIEESQWTDRKVKVSRPLFPGYVFVHFTPAQRVLVLSTPGIVRNGLGEAILDHDLERIRIALKEGYRLAPHVGAAEGTQVRFRKGLFSGAEGIATKVREDRLIIVALSIGQQYFSVESEPEAVEAVNLPALNEF